MEYTVSDLWYPIYLPLNQLIELILYGIGKQHGVYEILVIQILQSVN